MPLPPLPTPGGDDGAWGIILNTFLLQVKSFIDDGHKATHQAGGTDAIQLDNLAAPDDNADLNASTTAHGLLRKLSNVSTEFLNGQGNWAVPGGGGGLTLVNSAKSIGPGLGTVTGTTAETSLYAIPATKWTKYARLIVAMWGEFSYGGGASEVSPIFKLIVHNNAGTPISRIQWNTVTINGGALASPRTMVMFGYLDSVPNLLLAGTLAAAAVEGLVGQSGSTVGGQATAQWRADMAVDPDTDNLFDFVAEPPSAITITLSNAAHSFKLQRFELWGLQ